MYRRLQATALTLLLLSGLFAAYANLVTPLLVAPRRPLPPGPSVRDLDVGPPPENRAWAERFLPGWAASARWQGRWNQTLFFAGAQLPAADEATVRCAPFALIHVGQAGLAGAGTPLDARTPLIVLAEAAVVRFPDSVALGDPDPRLAVACVLEGNVTVSGPDGLVISGGHFVFDRQTMIVRSDDPVRIAWGSHRGTATGVEVMLRSPDASSQRGSAAAPTRQAKGPVELVRLKGDVRLSLRFEEQEEVPRETPAAVKADKADKDNAVAKTSSPKIETWEVACDGPMTFDPATLTATLQETVRVRRPAAPRADDIALHDPTARHGPPSPVWDSLSCRRLTLWFARPPGAGEGAGAGRRPVFVGLEALGEPVVVESEHHDLEAKAWRVDYQAGPKTVRLFKNVSARWGQGRLTCEQVELTRGADGRIARAVSRGAGSMTWTGPAQVKQQPQPQPQGRGRKEPTLKVPVTVRWSRRMSLRPDPSTGEDIVELEGEPLVRYGSDAALSAVRITAWLKQARSPRPGTPHGGAVSGRRPGQPAGLSLTRLLAREQVGAISPGAYVATSWLDVTFVPIASTAGKPAAVGIAAWPGSGASATGTSRTSESQVPAMITAEAIRAKLGVPAGGGGLELLEAVTTGGVQVSQEGRRGRESYRVLGDRIHVVREKLQGQDTAEMVVTIDGSPARMRSGTRSLSGRRIALALGSGRGEIDGAGTLSLPVGKTFSGQTAPPDTSMQVSWTERLILAGQRVTFLGDVAADWQHTRVTCDQLDVQLSRPPRLRPSKSDWRDVEVKSLHCRHAVEVDNYSYHDLRPPAAATDLTRPGGQARRVNLESPSTAPASGDRLLVRIAKARLADLRVDLQTGAARAGGPGWIVLWRQGRPRRTPLSPTAIARANTPLTLDAARWHYVRIDFADLATGNVFRSHATFQDQVQVLHGPVTRALESLDPDRLGREDWWLRCDSLQVSQDKIPRSRQPERDDGAKESEQANGPAGAERFTLLANGDATFSGRSDGQTYYGRADTISFDESRYRFVLRSLGQQKATFWRRTRLRDPFIRFEAQRVEYNPRTGQFVLDGTTEIVRDRN